MHAKICKLLIVSLVLLSSPLCLGAPTDWLDAVVSFERPTGSSDEGGPATNALGSNNDTFVSVDTPEVLTLAFVDNRATDGPGNDLMVYEYWNGDSSVDIYGSADNSTYGYIGRANGNAAFDLSGSGLAYVKYLRFVGLDNGGASAGFDLDAVQALNSVPAPGAILLGTIGTGLIGWLRRRRTL